MNIPIHNRYWLRNEMAQLLKDDPEAEDFEYSNGWLYHFCERKGITNQCRTEKKRYTVQESASQSLKTSIAA